MNRHVFAVLSLMFFVAPLYADEESPCPLCQHS